MSTKIEWTDTVWNPTTGCNKISAGCKNCYAERMHKRLQSMGQKKYQTDFNKGVQTWEDELLKPLSWKKPRRVFVNSMSDLFHEDVPFEFIDNVFAVMAVTPQHTYQVLTKRADRMEEYLTYTYRSYQILASIQDLGLDFGKASKTRPLPNVWLIVSVENQEQLDERVPRLLRCPAAVRGLSCEPLLGPLDLSKVSITTREVGPFVINPLTGISGNEDVSNWPDCGKIHWVIAGGESGPGARPMHPDWVRSLRDQCQAAGVPFFFKQWGEYLPANHWDLEKMGGHFADSKKKRIEQPDLINEGCWSAMYKVGKKAAGRLLDGLEWNEFPEAGGIEGEK